MSSPSDLMNRGRTAAHIVLYDGVIASSPATLDEKVEIRIPAFDRSLRFGPAPWMPRVREGVSALEVVRPSRGDPCVVGFAESTGAGTPELWVLAWEPK